MPQISVIIPAYNVELYIKQCIESIIRQTFRDIQIIIVNDGSTDDTGLVCKSYCRDKRITYIETENQGVAAARNIGIEQANAEYLCFVDSDDYLPENALEILYNNIDDADIVIGDYCTDNRGRIRYGRFFAENVSVTDRHKNIWLIGNALGCSFYGAKHSANIGVPWGKLYRKDFIQHVQGGGLSAYCKNAGHSI